MHRCLRVASGVIGFVLAWPSAVGAVLPTAYTLDPTAGRLLVLCRSTLHDFTIEAHEWWGQMRFDPQMGLLLEPAQVVVAVAALDSGNAKRDRDMRRMFEAERFPQIRFTAQRVVRTAESAMAQAGQVYQVEGQLQIREHVQPVVIPVIMHRDSELIVVTGSLELDLRDFKLRPPILLGFIRVNPRVVVRFESRWKVAS
jgi:polyisoprenoid-binding protein YceI